MLSEYPRVVVGVNSFVALVLQAVPFVLVGGVISAMVAVFIPSYVWVRWLPKNKYCAVVVAAGCGLILPTCECSSVSVAKRMMGSGVPPAVAVTMMLAAPSLNPLVMVATMTAFGGWSWALIRMIASVVAVIGVGLCITWWGEKAFSSCMIQDASFVGDSGVVGSSVPAREVGVRWRQAVVVMHHDVGEALGFLVLGAFFASVTSSVIPSSVVMKLGDYLVLAVIVMGVLAMVYSLCSYGDSFVAASFVGVHPAGMVMFMTLGPILDVKLGVMMEGVLGSSATRFLALTGFGMSVMSTFVIAGMLGWW